MIEIIEVSPINEVGVARRLQSMIAAAWPGVGANKDVRIVIAIVLRTLQTAHRHLLVDLSGGTEGATDGR